MVSRKTLVALSTAKVVIENSRKDSFTFAIGLVILLFFKPDQQVTFLL